MSRPVKEYIPSSVIEWVREIGLNEDELAYDFTADPLERDYEAEVASNERWMIFKPPTHFTVTVIHGDTTYSQRFFTGVAGWRREDKFILDTEHDDRPTGSLYGHPWGEPNDG